MILLQKSIMERFNTLIDSEKPLLIGFSAQWCGPCKITIPILKKLEKRLEDKITIIELDIDFPPNRNIIHRYRISSVPTFLLFQKGSAKWRFSGIATEKELETAIFLHTGY